MSSNPRKAVKALMPGVKPMTLGMWAALERIDSPLITGKTPRDTLELLPSLYLLTHDPRDIFKANLLDLAMEWASSQSVEVVATIRAECERQFKIINDVVPELSEKEKRERKKAMGRFPISSGGRPKSSTGATTRLCGASRQRLSRSCTAKTPSHAIK